ncbi:MAG: amidohydrolase family protein, partial [Anaerolineaceae bacterium]|nr:amidohydrolase family protein [Anaerolineaceae bacterium]
GIAWKANQPAPGLDDPIGLGGLTQRKIIRQVVAAVNALGLPHPVHLHAGWLGKPGNSTPFCETVRALDGQRTHLCHIQFYSYGDDGHGGLTSAAEQLVSCLAPFQNITLDAGQVLFGKALAVTADTSMMSYLRRLTRKPSISRQVEGEGGYNSMPLEYLAGDPTSAVQWAAGLELMLTFPDASRMFLTCDHPNGGPFLAYPQIIEWLMSRPARQAVLARIHPAGREKTRLGQIERELTLGEIISMTSWGPARALGLEDRGHLGIGALADLRCYQMQAGVREMFASPAWVMRRGRMVVQHGETVEHQAGDVLVARPAWDEERLPHLYRCLAEVVSVQPEHYALGESFAGAAFREVPCKLKA